MATTYTYSFDAWAFENIQVYGNVTATLSGNTLTVTAKMTEAYTAIYSSDGYKFSGNVEANMRLTVGGKTVTSAKCVDYHANGASATRSKSGYHKENYTNITVSTTIDNTTGSYPFTIAFGRTGYAANLASKSGTISVDARTYSVTYNGNGNTGGSTASQTKNYNETLTLRPNGFTRTGYHFTSWNTAADGSGTSYSASGSYTANAAVTLYAQWAIDTYAVTYNGNGATGGSTASQNKTYGTALTLQTNGFTRTNYTFLYWNTAADGTGTTYAAGESYTANAALTLYAIWKKNNIPVFVNDGGTIRQIEKAYVNVGGVIKEATVYVNVNGTIKELT